MGRFDLDELFRPSERNAAAASRQPADEPPATERRTGARLEAILLERGIVTPEQMLAARRLEKQSPGRRLCEILKEQGADERAVQQAIAELARMPFEAIDAKAPGAFDREMVAKLGLDHCRDVRCLMTDARGTVRTIDQSSGQLCNACRARLGLSAR